jgi:hypothetical protein
MPNAGGDIVTNTHTPHHEGGTTRMGLQADVARLVVVLSLLLACGEQSDPKIVAGGSSTQANALAGGRDTDVPDSAPISSVICCVGAGPCQEMSPEACVPPVVVQAAPAGATEAWSRRRPRHRARSDDDGKYEAAAASPGDELAWFFDHPKVEQVVEGVVVAAEGDLAKFSAARSAPSPCPKRTREARRPQSTL